MSFAVEFDFAKRTEGETLVETALTEPREGRFYWIDLEGEDRRLVLPVLKQLSAAESVWEWMMSPHGHIRFQSNRQFLFFSFVESRVQPDGDLALFPMYVILTETMMITLHEDQLFAIDAARSHYREGFYTAAKSQGFLLFELAEHLAQQYQNALAEFTERTEEIERGLLERSDKQLFILASSLIRSLLELRKHIVFSRETLAELATRTSPFVPETTQPFLDKKAALFERLSHDAATEREVLSECLTLYMGVVAHQTNKVVTRLTILSTIFLPLSFLVGLYGMNFDYMPELKLRYGYAIFWLVAFCIVAVAVFLIRRSRVM